MWLYNKLRGEKQLFIIFTVSVVRVCRQGPVGTACFCCVMFGALLSWKVPTNQDWSCQKAVPSHVWQLMLCIGLDLCRTCCQNTYMCFFHVAQKLFITLWLVSKGVHPKRESQVEVSYILYLVPKFWPHFCHVGAWVVTSSCSDTRGWSTDPTSVGEMSFPL